MRHVKVPRKLDEVNQSKQASRKKTNLTKRPRLIQKDVGSSVDAQVAQLRSELYSLRKELRTDMVRDETDSLELKTLKADADEIKAMLLDSGLSISADAQKVSIRQASWMSE